MSGADQTPAQRAVGDVVPELARLTDEVLFGEVWRRAELPPRERSLITVAALVALGRSDQLSFHFPHALRNGVTPAELSEVVTHLAFYSGWPTAMSAAAELRTALRSNPSAAG